ncbi:hypothetical protein C0995_007772 [Termitomyces sp. Mi166|nr:hypothetical protein C0995_007772 [Termitomyces sp. Mi166\
MAPKISLLHVSPDASLLEREHAAQKFIVATNAVFLKAQGLATLVPLHETAFSLLEGLLDDWHLLNLTTIEWLRKAEVRQACINIWSLNKQVPWASEFGKTVQMSWEHAISTIEQIKLMHFEKMAIELESTTPTGGAKTRRGPGANTCLSYFVDSARALSSLYCRPFQSADAQLSLQEQEESVPRNKGKGKAKATEDDDDDEETAQKLRKELEDFVAPTTFDNKLLVSLLPPPSEYFEGDSRLPRGSKISGGRKGDIMLVSPATRALVLEKNGACDRCIADNMADHCWYLTGERPCWRCFNKSKGCLWNGVGVRTQKKRPPLAALVVAKHVKLVQAAKAFLERQGKPSQFFVLEGYKGKGKVKALVEDSETTGAKQSFKSRELVDSDSDKEEEEDRTRVIKKIKHDHVEEPTGVKRRKEIVELDDKVEIVAAKIPVAGPSRLTSKPIVLVPSVSKYVPKPIITLASPIAGPSTAPIASCSAPKAAAALSKPTPAKSAGPTVKGGFAFKDPFMVRQFKLAGTEESGALIINQATEVPATQGTLRSDESGDEDAIGNNDDGDDDDGAMNVDSAKQPEETWPVVPIKTVTEVKAPASAVVPALPTKPPRTPFLKLHCTTEHFPYLLLGLQAPIQFEQNQPSVEQWRNRAHGHYEVVHEMLEDARCHFESVCQELQWVTMQHNAMALYLCDCDAVNWHKMNNIELGEFLDTKDLPVTGGFPVIYPH